MNKILVLIALAGISSAAEAIEYAHVISSTPVLGEVTVPQRNCWDEQQQVQQPKSGAGAVIGAVAGGLLGSTMGHGSGNAAATAAGVITGAVVGDNLEDRSNTTTQTVRRCETTHATQRKTIGYDVVYEYAGQQYSARLANDPGRELAINVSPSDPSVAQPVQTSNPTTTIIEQTPTVVYRQAPTVYVEPAPIMFGWWGWGHGPGYGHGGHFRH